MKIIKSILNNTISKMVTRERVLKVTGVSEEEYDIDQFVKDFREEGWCKRDLRIILDTLFHLDRAIDDYGWYWF